MWSTGLRNVEKAGRGIWIQVEYRVRHMETGGVQSGRWRQVKYRVRQVETSEVQSEDGESRVANMEADGVQVEEDGDTW